MKYDKQKLEESKNAYHTAKDLENFLNNKKTGNDIELMVWMVNLLFLLGYAFLFHYGTAEIGLGGVLVESTVVLSPAILWSCVRGGVRKIVGLIKDNKIKKADFYLRYEYEKQEITKCYSKSIDKIIAMTKSKDKQNKDAMMAIVDETVRAEEKYKLSKEQMTEITRTVMTHFDRVTKDLPKEEKEKLYKVFLEIGRIR